MKTNKTIQEYVKSIQESMAIRSSPYIDECLKTILEEYGNQCYEQGKAEQKEIDIEILQKLHDKENAMCLCVGIDSIKNQ